MPVGTYLVYDCMDKIRSFTDLNTWKEGHKLVIMIYKTTEDFPSKEIFGLTSQMRRSAVSVTSNIAEGFSRSTNKDKYKFYSISHGSLAELQSQLLVARDINYLDEELFKKIFEQITIVGKLISGLKRIKNV